MLPTSTWKLRRIANACVLVELADATILTDPWFSKTRALREVASIRPAELPELTAIAISHWGVDHANLDPFETYRFKETTRVFTSESYIADRAVKIGFRNVETLEWGESRQLTDHVTIESIVEHRSKTKRSKPGKRSNNYGFISPDVRMFFGGAVFDVQAIEDYASEAPAFDVVIGPVNGETLLGRRLVVTAAEMLEVAKTLGARVLVPVHDSHRAFGPLLKIPSSANDFATLPLDDVDVVQLDTDQPYEATTPKR